MDDNDGNMGEDLMPVLSDDESVELFEDDIEEIIVPQNLDGPAQNDSDEDEDVDVEIVSPSSPVKDDSEFVFKKHTGPVFCCALDPINGNLAVTGGEDEKAYVWVAQTGEVVFECEGHKDSVTMVGFSHDGKYLATGDMTGYIKVWKVATRSCIMVQVGSDMTWMQWHHGTRALLYGQANGDVYMWKVGSSQEDSDSRFKLFVGYNTSTDCAVIMPDGRRIAVGYSDGGLKIYDLKSAQVLGSVTAGQAHSAAVSCVDTHSDNNIIATGGGDGKVTLFKTQPLKVLWSFNCCEEDDVNAFVEAIVFSKDPNLPLLAVGTLNGRLHILDFTRQVIRHRFRQEAGICRIVWDRHSSVVFVGGLDGVIRLYDARSGKLQSQLRGHKECLLDMFLSKDGNTLISASDDATSRIFAVSQPER